MAESKIARSTHFRVVDYTLQSVTIGAGNMKEWSGINIYQEGYTPLCLARVTTNKSGLAICGFSLSRTTNTAYLMAKNVTDASITADSAALTVLYIKN